MQLVGAQQRLRKMAKRKFTGAVKAVIAVNRMKHTLAALGVRRSSADATGASGEQPSSGGGSGRGGDGSGDGSGEGAGWEGNGELTGLTSAQSRRYRDDKFDAETVELFGGIEGLAIAKQVRARRLAAPLGRPLHCPPPPPCLSPAFLLPARCLPARRAALRAPSHFARAAWPPPC